MRSGSRIYLKKAIGSILEAPQEPQFTASGEASKLVLQNFYSFQAGSIFLFSERDSGIYLDIQVSFRPSFVRHSSACIRPLSARKGRKGPFLATFYRRLGTCGTKMAFELSEQTPTTIPHCRANHYVFKREQDQN